MSFHDVDDPELAKMSLSKHTEVMVGGEVAALDVELVEDVSGGDVVGPNILDMGVLQLVVPVVMVLVDFGTEEAPVALDVSVYLDYGVAHCSDDKICLL